MHNVTKVCSHLFHTFEKKCWRAAQQQQQQLQTQRAWPLLLLPWELLKCIKNNPHPKSKNTEKHSGETKKKVILRDLKIRRWVVGSLKILFCFLTSSAFQTNFNLKFFLSLRLSKSFVLRSHFSASFSATDPPQSPLSHVTKITIAVWFQVRWARGGCVMTWSCSDFQYGALVTKNSNEMEKGKKKNLGYPVRISELLEKQLEQQSQRNIVIYIWLKI